MCYKNLDEKLLNEVLESIKEFDKADEDKRTKIETRLYFRIRDSQIPRPEIYEAIFENHTQVVKKGYTPFGVPKGSLPY